MKAQLSIVQMQYYGKNIAKSLRECRRSGGRFLRSKISFLCFLRSKISRITHPSRSEFDSTRSKSYVLLGSKFSSWNNKHLHGGEYLTYSQSPFKTPLTTCTVCYCQPKTKNAPYAIVNLKQKTG